jgi:hypothetical protein
MMNLQINAEGEAVPKRKGRRMRKREWRKKWLVLSQGATLEARAIEQTMRGPKLLAHAMPRVIPKNMQPPRSAESECGLKWQRSTQTPVNRPKKRNAKTHMGWDGLNHNGIVPVREFK